MAPRRARPFPRARRAATPSNARAEASRKNGAKSRGPKTPEGKARAAQNALKHGMRAQKYVLLPQEDAAAFAALETAIVAELAPEGVLQTLLARRVAVAAWRLERADRMEAEVLEFRSYEDANAGLALIRDGNATRSFDTLMRYRSAAMAEFWRALKTLKALQAEQAGACGRRPGPRDAAASSPARRRGSRPVLRRTNPSAGRCTITSSPTRPGPAAPCTSPQRAGCRTNPVLRECGMEVGRAPRARGGRAGSEIGTNPGSLSASLSMIPPRGSSEPERLVGTSP